MFFYEFFEISKNTFAREHLRTIVSVYTSSLPSSRRLLNKNIHLTTYTEVTLKH